MRNRRLVVAAAVVVVTVAGCDSCDKKKDEPAAGAVEPAEHAPAAMPAPGSDADQKRLDSLALVAATDGALSTFKHDEKPMGPDKKAEGWWIEAKPEKPKKIVVKDAKGETSYYFDDKGGIAYVRAPDGHFVFRMEGLALWLDPEQRVKHGVKPQEAMTRANALKKDASQALGLFGLR
jgi:hypothetical protein